MPYRKTPSPEVIPPGLPRDIEPEREYRVRLSQPVQIGAASLQPQDIHVMRGVTLEAIKGSVYGAVVA